MVPPELLPPTAVLPLPVTVKLPVVLVRTIPFGPPLVETLVSDTVNDVVPPARVISTAAAPVVVTVPLGMVMLGVLLVACKPRWFPSGVMVRAPKVAAPVFPLSTIPVPPDPVTDVAAKLSVAPEETTFMPIPVEFVTVVEPVVKEPPTLVRLIPVVALSVEEMLAKLPLRVPVVRFSALPVPFKVTSETFNVPKPVPLMSEVALPPVNPRRVLPEPTVIPLPVMFTIATVGFGPGKGSLPCAGVMPVIEERLAVASCPINLWPFSKVNGPT